MKRVKLVMVTCEKRTMLLSVRRWKRIMMIIMMVLKEGVNKTDLIVVEWMRVTNCP